MTGDRANALQAFQNTVREAALLASRRQLPTDRLWSFHEARHQCLDLSKGDLQPESTEMPEEPISPMRPLASRNSARINSRYGFRARRSRSEARSLFFTLMNFRTARCKISSI